MATQAGVPVPSIEMERAYLQGVDLEKVTLALIHANREGKEFTFQKLVEADLENRLHEKLGNAGCNHCQPRDAQSCSASSDH